ncbi:hypothetical protein [Mucilaginibacter sp. FT3.2]|uniref:hypothetical protein n=1 Tax=Mucilaginibacter sp. FT3.2 TaxID=2723090 RepID=UPI00160F6AA6|nr:hypothetical protein [Mucilaginibacter sp. FT3.2]MBB6234007.1 hypothetical protein [Mucilaginibacter sp. FT3.2]
MSLRFIQITIPKYVLCNVNGYDFFAKLAGETIAITNLEVHLYFAECLWFDGTLCAVLGNILDGLRIRNNKIRLFDLPAHILTTFRRNKFLEAFTDLSSNDQAPLTIPYQKFKLQDEDRAKDFIKKQLFDKPDMPKMSDEAKKSVLVSIFEVCVNAITHGKCDSVYTCGQISPNRIPPEVAIAFVDLGRTIKANVNEYLKSQRSGNSTILWALDEGNTTKTGAEPGGLGLKLLQNLINLNNGSLQIVSADGFIELKNGIFKEHQMIDYFPGTIVTIKLRLGDSNFYVLSNEIDTDNIF